MKFYQHIYTRCSNGVFNKSAGYDTAAMSKEIPESVIKDENVKGARATCEAANGSHVISITSTTGDGKYACISCSGLPSKQYGGNVSKKVNTFSHQLIAVAREMFEQPPEVYCCADGLYDGVFRTEYDDGSEGNELPVLESKMPQLSTTLMEDLNNITESCFCKLMDALYQLIDGTAKRALLCVVFDDCNTPEECTKKACRFMTVLYRLVPVQFRRKLKFCSFWNDESQEYYFNIIFSYKGAFNPTNATNMTILTPTNECEVKVDGLYGKLWSMIAEDKGGRDAQTDMLERFFIRTRECENAKATTNMLKAELLFLQKESYHTIEEFTTVLSDVLTHNKQPDICFYHLIEYYCTHSNVPALDVNKLLQVTNARQDYRNIIKYVQMFRVIFAQAEFSLPSIEEISLDTYKSLRLTNRSEFTVCDKLAKATLSDDTIVDGIKFKIKTAATSPANRTASPQRSLSRTPGTGTLEKVPTTEEFDNVRENECALCALEHCFDVLHEKDAFGNFAAIACLFNTIKERLADSEYTKQLFESHIISVLTTDIGVSPSGSKSKATPVNLNGIIEKIVRLATGIQRGYLMLTKAINSCQSIDQTEKAKHLYINEYTIDKQKTTLYNLCYVQCYDSRDEDFVLLMKLVKRYVTYNKSDTNYKVDTNSMNVCVRGLEMVKHNRNDGTSTQSAQFDEELRHKLEKAAGELCDEIILILVRNYGLPAKDRTSNKACDDAAYLLMHINYLRGETNINSQQTAMYIDWFKRMNIVEEFKKLEDSAKAATYTEVIKHSWDVLDSQPDTTTFNLELAVTCRKICMYSDSEEDDMQREISTIDFYKLKKKVDLHDLRDFLAKCGVKTYSQKSWARNLQNVIDGKKPTNRRTANRARCGNVGMFLNNIGGFISSIFNRTDRSGRYSSYNRQSADGNNYVNNDGNNTTTKERKLFIYLIVLIVVEVLTLTACIIFAIKYFGVNKNRDSDIVNSTPTPHAAVATTPAPDDDATPAPDDDAPKGS